MPHRISPNEMSKSPPQLFVNGGPLDPSQVGFLRPTDSNTTDAEEVRRRLKEDGYVFLKGLLPREDVLKTREQYFEYLAPTGSLKPDFRPVDGTFDLSKNKTDFPGIGAGEEPFNKATGAMFHGEPWYKDQFCQHPIFTDYVSKVTKRQTNSTQEQYPR